MAGRQLTEEDMNRGLSKDQVLERLGRQFERLRSYHLVAPGCWEAKHVSGPYLWVTTGPSVTGIESRVTGFL